MLRAHAAVLDLRVEIRLVGRGADVARLLDDEHAAIVEAVAAALVRAGWAVEPEASYSEYGERGRIDLLAFDPAGRVLAVVEVKTELADLQDLFGSLDAKVRLAPALGRRKGWHASRVARVLAVAATEANRSVVRAHPALFAHFESRGLCDRWLQVRDQERVLLWIPASAAGRPSWLAGRKRVRRLARE